MKSTLEDIFGKAFGDMLNAATELRPGQEVTARTGPDTLIRGILVANPTNIFPFCVIDGTITTNGVSRKDNRILAPKDKVRPTK